MTPKIELRFVRQKVNKDSILPQNKVLQFRCVFVDEWDDLIKAKEWQTVPFDESVVLEPEE